MPVDVDALVQGRGMPLCVPSGTTMQEALDIMIRHDYSQLPVVNADNKLLGIISEHTLTRQHYLLGGTFNLFERTVNECMVEAKTLEPEASLAEVVDNLEEAYAVVIVQGGTPVGIVTTYDIMNYLHQHFESFMDIEDVEQILRKYTLDALPEESTQKAALIHALGHQPQDPSHPRKQLNELTFGEQLQLMIHPHTWPKFAGTLEPKFLFERYMHKVRGIRNQLAHFRGAANTSQSADLKFALSWLNVRPKLPAPLGAEPVVPVVTVTGNLTVAGRNQEDGRQHEGKYGPLRTWLERYDGEEPRIKLSFSDVEQILGSPLPPTASQHRSWWANDSVGHSQSKAWLAAHWRVNDVDLPANEVTFARVPLSTIQDTQGEE